MVCTEEGLDQICVPAGVKAVHDVRMGHQRMKTRHEADIVRRSSNFQQLKEELNTTAY